MLGRDVEIVVNAVEKPDGTRQPFSGEFWNPPALSELAQRQRHRGSFEIAGAFGSLADADWEGFEPWLERRRQAMEG